MIGGIHGKHRGMVTAVYQIEAVDLAVFFVAFRSAHHDKWIIPPGTSSGIVRDFHGRALVNAGSLKSSLPAPIAGERDNIIPVDRQINIKGLGFCQPDRSI